MDSGSPYPLPSFPGFHHPIPASIPLRCNICSSKPTFSDTSHLLTHIASKGHLSTYYKIKVQSGQDEGARLLIDDYDAWYATWGIEALMSERMNLKEKKRKEKADQNLAANYDHYAAASQHHGPYFRHGYSHLDPSLGMQTVKEEDGTADATGLDSRPPFALAHSVAAPPWMSMPHGPHPVPSLEYRSVEDEIDLPRSYTLRSPTPVRRSRVSASLDVLSQTAADDKEVDDDSRSSDYAKLKGILWPGMDIFDSATPEMKKKRNQKKSTDILDRLEASSRYIEATEIVYSAGGAFEKSRPITGFPHSDSSPMKAKSSPSPKKPRRAPRRKALAPKDANAKAAGSSRPRGRRSASARSLTMFEDENVADGSATEPVTKATKRGRKRKTDSGENTAASLSQPAPMSYLNSHFPHEQFADTDHPISAAAFRPADHFHYHHTPAFNTAPDIDPTGGSAMGPGWEFLSQDFGGFLLNPLYMSNEGEIQEQMAAEDDEGTISASASDR